MFRVSILSCSLMGREVGVGLYRGTLVAGIVLVWLGPWARSDDAGFGHSLRGGSPPGQRLLIPPEPDSEPVRIEQARYTTSVGQGQPEESVDSSIAESGMAGLDHEPAFF